MEIQGTFEIRFQPQPAAEDRPAIGRMWLDKQYSGPLSGTSQGEMIAWRTPVENSAGYTAIEVVTGRIAGRSGSFALQHSATMNRGVPAQQIQVIPDSGTGELTGLQGDMTIEVTDGVHRYVFDYTL